MSSFTELFHSSDNPKSLGAKFRRRRIQDFDRLVSTNFSKDQAIKILDVGGAEYFWNESALLKRQNISIVLLNLEQKDILNPIFKSLVGNATAMDEFEDKSFDIVFSNSVIEHLKIFENQKKMADEIKRVGRTYFVQTPNKFFPVESHYALPFAQFFPKNLLFFLLTKTKLSRLNRWRPEDAAQYLDEIKLLGATELLSLFPEANIYRETFVGLTKSVAAHNFGI